MIGWIRQAIDLGDAKAEFNMGLCYKYGWGLEENDTKAISWFRQAAEHHCAEAQTTLGIAYNEGTGLGIDQVEAGRWLKMAVNGGHLEAQDYLHNHPILMKKYNAWRVVR